jgi:hypothetical protein
MNHVSLTGPEGYRSEGHEGRRKRGVGQLALGFTQLFLVKMQGFLISIVNNLRFVC